LGCTKNRWFSGFFVPIKNSPIRLVMTVTEIIGYLAATLTTSSFLPQALLTLKTRDTDALSLSMYSLFAFGVLLWLIYGIFIHDKAVIFANAITFALASLILSVKIHNTLKARKAKSTN
jgi:MtN3 and saliva related transmembrane protein